VLGRFLSADTDTTDGYNRFAYVRNNPVRYNDPTGRGVTGTDDYGREYSGPATRPDCLNDGGPPPLPSCDTACQWRAAANAYTAAAAYQQAADLNACAADLAACQALASRPRSLPLFPGAEPPPAECDIGCRFRNAGDAVANGINKVVNPLGLRFSTNVRQNWKSNGSGLKDALKNAPSQCRFAQFQVAWGVVGWFAALDVENSITRATAQGSAGGDVTAGAIGVKNEC